MATERGRGKKQDYTKNSQANREWQTKKRVGRPKQVYVFEGTVSPDGKVVTNNHWEKVTQ